jgi:hypothetical protein
MNVLRERGHTLDGPFIGNVFGLKLCEDALEHLKILGCISGRFEEAIALKLGVRDDCYHLRNSACHTTGRLKVHDNIELVGVSYVGGVSGWWELVEEVEFILGQCCYFSIFLLV